MTTEERRRAVFDKGFGRCWYCGGDLTLHRAGNRMCIDHIVPRSAGGSNWLPNLAPCCRPCNLMKDNMSVEEFRRHLAERKARWPEFTPEQVIWLERQGFVFPPLPTVVFWFEMMPGAMAEAAE